MRGQARNQAKFGHGADPSLRGFRPDRLYAGLTTFAMRSWRKAVKPSGERAGLRIGPQEITPLTVLTREYCGSNMGRKRRLLP